MVLNLCTNAGLMSAHLADKYFRTSTGIFVNVYIEFDIYDPVDVCLKRHSGNYGRLLCYVHQGDDNYNLKLIKEGWSPFFYKYGRSRINHEKFTNA